MGYGNPDIEDISTEDLIKEIKRRQEEIRLMRCPYCHVPLSANVHTCKYAKDQEHFTKGLLDVTIH